jgi:hypothetical protein
MTIDVTKEDLENAKPFSADACPIALAANRATKLRCQVHYAAIMERKKAWLLVYMGDGRVYIHNLSLAITSWIEAFDRTGKGRLFEFTIDWKGLKNVQE